MVKLKSALIVGAGDIASGYDRIEGNSYLTHAKACVGSGLFSRVAIYDIDEQKTLSACAKWNVEPLLNWAVTRTQKFDLISVCVPTRHHSATISDILRFEHLPSVLILEKPVTGKSVLIAELTKQLDDKRVRACVNYVRRYDDVLVALKGKISAGVFGELLLVRACYGKGLINNGSHLINILIFLFDDVHDLQIRSAYRDYDDEDLSVSFTGRVGAAPLVVDCVPSDVFSIFELELVFSRRRLRFYDSFLRYSEEEVVEDPVFSGYRSLGDPREALTTLNRSLLEMVREASMMIDDPNLESRSSLWDCRKTIALCEQLKV